MNLLDRGALDPGKKADFVLLDDLEFFDVYATYQGGNRIYQKGDALQAQPPGVGFSGAYYHSIHLAPQDESRFTVNAPVQDGSVRVRVMELHDGSTKTDEKIIEMPVRNGVLCWEGSGCLLAAVFERYGKNGGVGFGFVTGDCHKQGAVATSYAHDCHNVLVAGGNAKDMAAALNRVIQLHYVVLHVDPPGQPRAETDG